MVFTFTLYDQHHQQNRKFNYYDIDLFSKSFSSANSHNKIALKLVVQQKLNGESYVTVLT